MKKSTIFGTRNSLKCWHIKKNEKKEGERLTKKEIEGVKEKEREKERGRERKAEKGRVIEKNLKQRDNNLTEISGGQFNLEQPKLADETTQTKI